MNLSNRSQIYTDLIAPFVKKYADYEGHNLCAELGTLRKHMGYGNLQYNAEEGNRISEKMDDGTQKFAGLRMVSTGHIEGPAMLQMFDFIATMDDFDKSLTLASSGIERLKQGIDFYEGLRDQMPGSDMRTWGFQVQHPQLDAVDKNGNRITIGQALGEPVIYDPANLIRDGKVEGKAKYDPAIRQKTPYELSQDEAHLLNYKLTGTLIALEQGLFQTRHTKVFAVDLSDEEKEWNHKTYQKEGFTVLDSGLWVNQFTQDGAWHPLKNNINTQMKNLRLLQGKDRNLKHYPDNRFYRERLRKGLPVDVINDLYNPDGDGLKNFGGAIGMYYFTKTLQDVEVQGKEGIQGGIEKTTMEKVEGAMRDLDFHPIRASANLGRAFRETKLADYFRTRLQAVQSLNFRAQIIESMGNDGKGEALKHRNTMVALRNGRVVCGPGTIPSFRDIFGNPIALNQAYDTAADGSLVLGSNVDPNYDCKISFTANAFKIKRTKPKSAFLPVLYDMDTSGGWQPKPVEFFVASKGKAGRLLEYFTTH